MEIVGKKKRGRPSKKIVDKEVLVDDTIKVVEQKKKRGRPPKEKKDNEELFLLDDDVVETKKKRKKSPEYLKEPYQFIDSIEVVGGDARKHFNIPDDGMERSIWCVKREFTMYLKMCGFYVTNKCRKRLRCRYYDYGLEIKHRYRLKTNENADTKKPKKIESEGE